MYEPDTHSTDLKRQARRCPSCGSGLDPTGAGSDQVLECTHCGLVMFDGSSRSRGEQ